MLKVFNSLTEQKEEFIPLDKGKIRMYVCGPTVYGPGHIGHARTYSAFDMIRRYLEYLHYQVNYVVNITDVHDDMIKRAREQNTDLFSLGKKYTDVFFKDLTALHIQPATVHPKVTEHIPEIISLIQILLKKRFAYETEDGVYFKVSAFADYGKLSKIKKTTQVTGLRVNTDKYEKHSAQDFALWKKVKTGEEGIASWDAPFGNGRPGWHIECSAMNLKHLGTQIDLHGGAQDLKFPHHENEIAQSEAATGKKPFVKYWLHSGFLNVEGEKMSKSLGNYIEIQDLLKKHSGKEFRFFISQMHYRSRLDFSWNELEKTIRSLNGLNLFLQRLQEVSKQGIVSDKIQKLTETARESFIAEMNDDFNFPNGWAVVYAFEKQVNKAMDLGNFSKQDTRIVLDFFKELDSIFEIFSWEQLTVQLTSKEKELIDLREKLRKEKKFKEADAVRVQLTQLGIQLDDTSEGLKIRKL
ncbi:MAG: cysteine--tRNA ligase [Candidatus Diapherotrites archaeon]|nr:cysteine--tRNA ligase [Candidatus Diapherotrites archaeon]